MSPVRLSKSFTIEIVIPGLISLVQSTQLAPPHHELCQEPGQDYKISQASKVTIQHFLFQLFQGRSIVPVATLGHLEQRVMAMALAAVC